MFTPLVFPPSTQQQKQQHSLIDVHGQRKEVSIQFRCFCTKRQRKRNSGNGRTAPELWKHNAGNQALYGFPSNGCELRCTVGDCPRVFTSFQRLKDHAISQHRDSVSNKSYTGASDGFCGEDSGQDSDDVATSSEKPELQKWGHTESTSNFQQSVMRFLSAMGSKPGIQTVTEELGSLVHDLKDYAVQTVHELCNKLSVPRADPRVAAGVSNLNEVPQFLSDLGTEHKRKKWLVENGYLIEPKKVVLGTRTEQRYSSQLRRNRPVIVKDTFQYIPIDKLLVRAGKGIGGTLQL